MKGISIKSIKTVTGGVICHLQIDGNDEYITTTVNDECIPYLSADRIDAYVVGLLYFAMKHSFDFHSNLPISEDLYYAIKAHFIPGLLLGNKSLHAVEIHAPLASSPECKDKSIRGTGISCGVDSLYTLAVNESGGIPKSHRINSLFFFNVGAGFKGGKDLRTPLIEGRLNLGKKFAKKYGYHFFFIESNIHLVMHKYFSYDHLEMESFMALFCIFTLQKGIQSYHFSSSNSIVDFSVDGSVVEREGTCMFDMFTYACLSVNGMKLYSEGSEVERLDKVKVLSTWEPAFEFLNVCVNELDNCNVCGKCIRTILEINAVGDIHKFKHVFDVDFFEKNYKSYLRRLYIDAVFKKDFFLRKLYVYYRKEISTMDKCRWIFSILMNKLLKRNEIL